MISIIVPAHDEAALIGRCLRGLRDGLSPEQAEIVVVCNGCRDDTALRARETDVHTRVIETEAAGKIHALAIGDAAASGFPRFYLDADVVTSGADLLRVSHVLERGEALAAAPRLRVDTSRSSVFVRAYYRTWLALPYHRSGMIGSGLYALSREGRARFDAFPEKLIADDGFVYAHFSPSERLTVEDAAFEITAPQRISGVVAVKTRSQKGLLQLRERFPDLLHEGSEGQISALARLARDPRRWFDCAVYVAVMLAAKWRARRLQHSRSGMDTWERDESSRTHAP